MTWTLFLEHTLNGLQYGVFLFLVSAGLTLVFGIMNMVNLAHGSLYMIGAYAAAWMFQLTGSFFLALAFALPFALIAGMLIEITTLRTLYTRDHLDQVLATFGMILFFNQLMIVIFGGGSQQIDMPSFLRGQLEVIPGIPYPSFRLAVIGVGILVAIGLFIIITRTRIGMLIRAGASNRSMLNALGVNVRRLYTIVFGFGALLAGLAGTMAGPLSSVEPGMGESILILAFVCIVIGGIGSIRGAFVASIIVGLVEIYGRSTLKLALVEVLGQEAGQTAAPALASMSIYILMAFILFFKPQGLFPARTG